MPLKTRSKVTQKQLKNCFKSRPKSGLKTGQKQPIPVIMLQTVPNFC